MRLSSAALLLLLTSSTTLTTVHGQRSITAVTDNYTVLSSPANGRSRNLLVLDNDFETDANGNRIGNGNLRISPNIVSQPADGTCVVSDDQKSIFWRTPGNNNGFRGTTTCRYQVCNLLPPEQRLCAEANVNLTVQPVRAIADRNIAVQPGQNTRDFNVINNDLSQPTDRVLRVTSVIKLSGRGSCSTVANNANLVRYTRPSDNNEDTITQCEYTVCTSRLPTEPAQPTQWCDKAVAVFQVDERAAPTYVAVPDDYTLPSTSISSGRIDVLQNDTSNRNKEVRSIITNPQFGICSINDARDGVLYKRPSNSFQSGVVTCRYEGCTVPLNAAERRVCGQADVRIDVTPPTPSVISNENVYNINLDTLTNFISRRLEVLNNDITNPPDRSIRIDSVSSPIDNGGGANSGQCVITGDGLALRFVPQGNNRIGQEVVCRYVACTNDARDEVCGESTRVLIRLIGDGPGPGVVTLRAVDDPNPNGGRYIIASDQASQSLQVLDNDVATPSRPLIVNRIVSQPGFGICTITPGTEAKEVLYTRANFPSRANGNTSCRYESCTIPRQGEERVCDTATIFLQVNTPTLGVDARNDEYFVNPPLDGVSRRLDVLTNDSSNPPGRPLRVDGITQQPNDGFNTGNRGLCEVTADRQAIVYRRQGNLNTSPVFCSYRACTNDNDDEEVCGTARVTIRLDSDFPVAINDAFTIFSQEADIFFLPVLTNDRPGANPPLRVFTTYTPTLPWVPFGQRRSTAYDFDLPNVVFPAIGGGLEIDPRGDRKLLLTQDEDRMLQKRGKVTIGIDGFTSEEVGIEEEPVIDEIILNDSSPSTEGGLCGPSNDRLGVDYIPPNGGDFAGIDQCAYIACNRFGNCDDALITILVEEGTRDPTLSPTLSPTLNPTLAPTLEPSFSPTAPTLAPTLSPTLAPTLSPTLEPTLEPTDTPSAPTLAPTLSPTLEPTLAPTLSPTELPTLLPTELPTGTPTLTPTELPTISPSLSPTLAPTLAPSLFPTASPTESPSFTPTVSPTDSPNVQIVQDPPTFFPTFFPTVSPTEYDPCKDDYWGWGGWDSSSSSSGSWDNDWWSSSKSRKSGKNRRRQLVSEEEEEHPEERRLSKSSKRGGRWEWNNRCKTSSKSGKGRKSGKGYRRWGNSGGWQQPKPSGWNKPKPSGWNKPKPSGWKGGGRPRYFKASSVNVTEVVNGDELI